MEKHSVLVLKARGLWLCSLTVAAALLFLAASVQAWASLGGDVTSVQADQAHIQASLRTTVGESYTVHEMQNASGSVVREYVSPQGKVFGIAWQAPWPADMHQLLGSYFDQYAQAVKSQSVARVGRRPLMIQQPGLVVQMAGHPRSFAGRAYLPDQLPANVKAEAIR
jgi:hypothetical protein